MRRSHLSTKKNTMVHRVDRREPKVGGKRLSENGKSPGFVPGMKLKSNGYGPWAELEAKLYPKPTTKLTYDCPSTDSRIT